MKKMRILLSLNRFYPEVGGAETNLYFQANYLAKNHDVTVFTPKRQENPDHEFINGYQVFRFFDLLNIKGRRPNLNTKTLSPGMFLKVLFGKRFDVIMCFPSINYNNMLVFLAAKFRGIPVILCSFDLLDYSKLIEAKGTINPNLLENHNLSKKEAFFAKRFDKIFAISNREINVFRKYNNNVDYSPVPILLDEYEKQVIDPRAKYKLEKSDFVFLSLGRISKIKGQDLALEAFIKIARNNPSSYLIFVGREDYEPELYAQMQKRIMDEGLENHVLFTGMVEREEVIGWLRYSDIHVIPVRFMNSGAVVVESWAAGTPVIQSNAVDPNLVVEEENGYLFKTENIEELAEKMNRAIKNREKLDDMSRNGRELVESRYTYEFLTDIYEKSFSEVLNLN